jgi:hypothetical protein
VAGAQSTDPPICHEAAPPDRNDRPHGGANNCTALFVRGTTRSAEPTSAPTEAPTASPSCPNACSAPLLLEPVRASVCNTGSSRNAQCPTGCTQANPLNLCGCALGPKALGRRAQELHRPVVVKGSTLVVTFDSKQPPISAPTGCSAHLGSHCSAHLTPQLPRPPQFPQLHLRRCIRCKRWRLRAQQPRCRRTTTTPT